MQTRLTNGTRLRVYQHLGSGPDRLILFVNKCKSRDKHRHMEQRQRPARILLIINFRSKYGFYIPVIILLDASLVEVYVTDLYCNA